MLMKNMTFLLLEVKTINRRYSLTTTIRWSKSLWQERQTCSETKSCIKVQFTACLVMFVRLIPHSPPPKFATGNKMKNTAILIKITNVFGFEHCQKYLGWLNKMHDKDKVPIGHFYVEMLRNIHLNTTPFCDFCKVANHCCSTKKLQSANLTLGTRW